MSFYYHEICLAADIGSQIKTTFRVDTHKYRAIVLRAECPRQTKRLHLVGGVSPCLKRTFDWSHYQLN